MAAVAGGDAIAHHLAGDLHRLLVVIGISRAQVRDGRVVDKRAVGQLRDVDGVVAFGGLVGEGCLWARERRERQRKGQRRCGHSLTHHERLTSLLFTTLRGSSVTTTSTMSAINVRNSRRPAHISSM